MKTVKQRNTEIGSNVTFMGLKVKGMSSSDVGVRRDEVF